MSDHEVLSASDELDLSGDSAVEIREAVFTISEAEQEQTDSENGQGTRVNLVFTSDDFPYPITMRFFISYTPTDSSKDTSWVNRQRGQLKNIAKAATGEPRLSLNPDSPTYIVGKQVKATTRDGGDGFAVLSKFRSVE